MVAAIKTITCNFIGDFKVGDNVLANAAALCRLSSENEQGIFNKLIVVQAGSIVEAALDQIIYRAQNYTKEGVPNIPDETLKKIRDTKIERFNNIIQAMKKHRLLDGLGADIYKQLDRLREFRNRIHIQFDDVPAGVGRDDSKAFTDATVVESLALCSSVLEYLGNAYPRPKELGVYAHDISIPQG
jgi:hypothetical protein